MLALLGSVLALHCGGESTTPDAKRASNAGGHAGSGARAGMAGGGASGGCPLCGAGNGGMPASGAAGGPGHGGAGGQSGAAGSGGRGEAGFAADAGATGTAAGGSGAGSAGGASLGGRAGRGSGGSSGDVTLAGAGGEPEPAGDTLAIAKVAIYQAVEIPLMDHGSEIAANENAPVLDAREALLRVWLDPTAAWTPRQVTGDLTVKTDAGTRTARATLTVQAASTDGDLASTLDFTVRAGEIAQTTTLAVQVHEATTGGAALAQWPASGERLLNAESSNGAFLVTLVPLIVNGFTPDVGEANRARFERYLTRLYPASAVDVAVRDAVKVSTPVYADGTGWDEALDDLLATRDADDPPPNVYYYGVLTPGASFDGYCQNDCVVGLSNVAGRTQEGYRGAIGTGYFAGAKDTFSQETMAHELGHALGREHSPCGTDDAERAFPYRTGYIGVYGWDGTRLLEPDTYTDVMGYCVPVWISDYTYAHLFERIFYVNGLLARDSLAPAARSVRVPHRTLRVGSDGRLHWGHTSRSGVPVDGDTANIDLLDANGRVVRTLTVPFAPFDHLPGGFLSLPSDAVDDPAVTRVRVGTQTLDVR
jgi:hypothetical protein